MKKKKIERSASDIAYDLLEVRGQINELRRVDKALSEDLKERIHKGETQEYYKLRKDFSLAVADQEKAFKFASEIGCVKVDVPSVDKYLKSQRAAIPEGFALKETEKLVEVKDNEIAQENYVIQG